MTALSSVYRWVELVVTRTVQASAILASTVMVLSMIVGVFFRYVMQNSLSWTDEIALLCFSWTVFLTAALAVRDNSHVRVEVIDGILSLQVKWLLNQAIWIAIALVGAYMVWTGLDFVDLNYGDTSPALRYPVWIRDVSLPVSGVLIIIFALGNLQAMKQFEQHQEKVA